MDLLKYRKRVIPDGAKLVLSVSGGRTSMFMAYFVAKSGIFKGIETLLVFANTGKEKPETLDFVQECSDRWDMLINWVEAVVNPEKGKGTTYRIVDYKTASRKGEPFDAVIQKYGIPNNRFLHCTRELKIAPIYRYSKSVFKSNVFYTAQGIRTDERQRINRKTAKGKKFIYPFVDIFPVDEAYVRNWWDAQNFDLKIKDYEGNCDFCYKKSLRKRLTLLKEGLNVDQWEEWEKQSEYYFDRHGHLIGDLKEMAKLPFRTVTDKHEDRKKQGDLFADMDRGGTCFCL